MKDRLDKVLVLKGLVKSRELARAFIMEGRVYVDGVQTTKAGTLVKDNSSISVEADRLPFVSRGGLKLEAALEHFNIDVKDKVIMDVGSSTGGFTDCVIKRGAKKIFCIDVGYGQLDWSLRNDPRVFLLERTNARYLDKIISDRLTEKGREGISELVDRDVDMAVMDVSFISVIKVLPAILGFIKQGGVILSLIKPQFEVGKGEVGKGGIVREEEKRISSVDNVRESFKELGLETKGVFQSPVPGQKGNIEYFILAEVKGGKMNG